MDQISAYFYPESIKYASEFAKIQNISDPKLRLSKMFETSG